MGGHGGSGHGGGGPELGQLNPPGQVHFQRGSPHSLGVRRRHRDVRHRYSLDGHDRGARRRRGDRAGGLRAGRGDVACGKLTATASLLPVPGPRTEGSRPVRIQQFEAPRRIVCCDCESTRGETGGRPPRTPNRRPVRNRGQQRGHPDRLRDPRRLRRPGPGPLRQGNHPGQAPPAHARHQGERGQRRVPDHAGPRVDREVDLRHGFLAGLHLDPHRP